MHVCLMSECVPNCIYVSLWIYKYLLFTTAFKSLCFLAVDEPKKEANEKKKVKSFSDFQKLKGKQWKSLVTNSKKGKNAVVDVKISIGLYEFSPKDMKLKPKRGKRMALTVSNVAPYAEILKKAVDKWESFHSDCYDEEEDYMLLLEDGKEALFLPGAHREFFTLKKYREELGKDHNKIILFLCTRSDFKLNEDGPYSISGASSSKKSRLEAYFNADVDETIDYIPDDDDVPVETANENDISDVGITLEVESQITGDETLARKLQSQFDNDHSVNLLTNESMDDVEVISASPKRLCIADLSSLIKTLEHQVDKSDQFFLVVRRGAPFLRLLSLWQRQCKKSSPEKHLCVKYMGENGIDSGAMAKEFLSDAIEEMGPAMFPNGVPVDSVYNIQNGNFRSCGELVATSIVQGGPPPRFLDGSAYNMLIKPDIDITKLDIQENFSDSDRQLFESIKKDVKAHKDMIIENGYTSIIEDTRKDEIVETVMVSITGKRLLYLKEFAEGLKLCGVLEAVRAYPEIAKELFVKGNESCIVDANYVYSLMSPVYSDEGTSKRVLEDSVLDHFQDFLMALEDESICGYTEAIAWEDAYSSKEIPDDAVPTEENSQFKTANLTPAGVLGWLTGQRHRPLNGNTLRITVKFDHDCLERNPNHTVCFPTVGACGSVITLPITHMKTRDQFKEVFLLAFCKGGAFATP